MPRRSARRFAMTRVFVRGTVERADRGVRPYGWVASSVVGRDDVGSELSAAGGRSSEVSEWPRSKFPASAVRQRRNFGHRSRITPPYERGTRSAAGNGGLSGRPAPTEAILARRL